MFEIADVSLAVANATPKVRRAATATIGGNAAEGVAEWLALENATGKLTRRRTIRLRRLLTGLGGALGRPLTVRPLSDDQMAVRNKRPQLGVDGGFLADGVARFVP